MSEDLGYNEVMEKPTIIAYLKTGCPWCVAVKDYFTVQHIAFEEKNVTESRELFDEMVALSGQSKAPVVIINGEKLIDTDKEAVEAFVKNHNLL